MSAMLSAIEIYNKPRFEYRDEVFSILVINAWELLLKAIVSKAGKSVFYPKRRDEPYRSLSWNDAFWRAANSHLWPMEVEKSAVGANLELLAAYRDNAIHFYNDRAFGSIVYALAQTSIMNFRDVAKSIFQKDIANDITWKILPLGVDNPIDPVKFMKSGSSDKRHSRAVQDFLSLLKKKTEALDDEGVDTGRLLTTFDVTLQSVKKVSAADIVVGVTSEELADTVIVSRRVDPNLSHPYRQKDVLPKLQRPISTYEFQAIVQVFKLREDHRYCWIDSAGYIVRWSPDVVKFIDRLTQREIDEARTGYLEFMKEKRENSKPGN